MSDNKDYIEGEEKEIIDGNDGVESKEYNAVNDNIDDTENIEDTLDKKEDTVDKEENKDDKDYEDFCYLCKRTESKAGKMISIPGNICICADCLQKTMNSFSSMGPKGFNLGGSFMSNDDEDNPFGNIMGVNIMNFSDFQDMMSKKQKIKKKKETKKEEKEAKKKEQVEDIFDIKNIPAPHIIKQKLDEYVIGQEHAKKVIYSN